jgi:hypothetical protein
VRNLHQLGGAVAVVGALVGLRLKGEVGTQGTACTAWDTADSCSVQSAVPTTEQALLRQACCRSVEQMCRPAVAAASAAAHIVKPIYVVAH